MHFNRGLNSIYVRYLLSPQILKYFLAGLSSTIVYIATSLAAFYIFSLNVTQSHSLGYILSVCPHFIFNYYYTFQDKDLLLGRTLLRYFAILIFGYNFMYWIIYCVTYIFSYSLATASIVAIILNAFTGYYLSKVWAFRSQ